MAANENAGALVLSRHCLGSPAVVRVPSIILRHAEHCWYSSYLNCNMRTVGYWVLPVPPSTGCVDA